jgi:hypothetical protein
MNSFTLEMCKKQGYVPIGCTMPGQIILELIKQSKDPCHCCNEDRDICKGKPKK